MITKANKGTLTNENAHEKSQGSCLHTLKKIEYLCKIVKSSTMHQIYENKVHSPLCMSYDCAAINVHDGKHLHIA